MNTTKRILVVDDEPDLELLITQKFRRQIKADEYKFYFAGDGDEALTVLETNPEVDVVLSDINMPRMDGLTLLKRLQEIEGDLRAVIISAYGDMKNIRTAMNLGAFDFVTKPIEFADLEVTINKTFDDLYKLRELHVLREAAERGREALSRYFSPNLAQQLAHDPGLLERVAERRELSFVFTDLADFTPLVETTEPAEIVPVLNEYLDNMTEIVFRHEGTVENIVGDAVHAMFGAPVEQADHAARAVECAMDMDRFAEEFRQRKNAEGIAIGVTRIGVHTGPVIVGNFGGERFFDYTAHGDAINTAARLEGANKALGTRICVSAQAAESIPSFSGRPVGNLVLRGRVGEVTAFEPLSEADAASPQMQAYVEAYAKLKALDPGASQAFAAVVGQFGNDPLATFHLKRLLAGESGASVVLG